MIRKMLLGAAFALLTASPLYAQMPSVGPIKGPDGQKLQAPNAARARPAPVGVPGSRAEPELAVPADRPAGEMPPTEALFDAVNRGDANAARDAIGRGADIFGRNVLGLTPLELAVDLGRNDISFLLLSLRGGAGYSTSGGPATASKPMSPTEQRRAERQAELEARREQQAATRAATRVSAAPPATPRTARLFGADGGTAVPGAGFLGFDSAR